VLTDAHVHLSDPELEGAAPIILPVCRASGIKCLCVSAEPLSARRALELARAWPDVVSPFVGLHPWEVDEEKLGRTLDLLREARQALGGIGEIGLDGRAMKERGKEPILTAFRLQLEVAEEERLPVSVHCREAVAATLEVLSSYSLKGVLLHWFSGERAELRRAMDAGWYVSVGPSLLYSKRSEQVAREANRELLLIESDGPVRYRELFDGRPATPLVLPSVLLRLSSIWGVDALEAERQLEENTKRYLAIKS
jgi:TatD DNase family protein